VFDETLSKVSKFIIAYKLYIKMKMRETAVEEQIEWILLYMQERLADMWKENILEDLEAELLEYEIVEEFLTEIREGFGRGDKKSEKVAELKRLEQEERTMEEFMQEFRRVARGSRYERRLLVEEFTKGFNATIYQRLMESEWQPSSIEQWYD